MHAQHKKRNITTQQQGQKTTAQIQKLRHITVESLVYKATVVDENRNIETYNTKRTLKKDFTDTVQVLQKETVNMRQPCLPIFGNLKMQEHIMTLPGA
jgi:hypothetical protein